MSTNDTTNTGDITLSSEDLVRLIGGGLENMDFMNPQLQQQLLQLKAQQQTAADPNLNTAVGSSPRAPKPKTSRQPSRGTQVHGPWVEIAEQPKARGLRFRYECEGRSAGSIPGETSTPERKTFPAIKIHNYNGPAVIVVSCVTKEEPYKPHPHNLVGKDCKKGVCTLRIRDTTTVSFPHLGIQCAKKKDVDGNLKMRQDINVDPFQTGFKHKGQTIDLNVVRLCFQVFLPDEQGKITRIVQPVVSQAIHDKKALNDLVICRVDRTSGKCRGGDEVFLLCEKINRDDIRVRFYEERDGQKVWEAFGDFGQNDVHRQYAIVFKTPPYRDTFLQQPVELWMQLQRSSDLEGSDPIAFTYQPEDPDPDRIIDKRKRKAAPLNYLQGEGQTTVSPETLKQRLKLKATRTATATRGKVEHMSIKEEVQSPVMPQYSLNNLTHNPQASMPSMTMPNASLLGGQSMSMMDMNATMASQNNMSGGKMQYTSVSSPQLQQQQQQATIPAVTINPQTAQLLAQTGLFNNQPNDSNPPLQQQQANQQNEALKQLLLQVLANQANQQGQQAQAGQQGQVQLGNQQNNPIVTNNDPNLQFQNQDMASMNSMNSMELIQSLMNPESLGSLGASGLNFSGFDGLSATDIDCDPSNVAGFETVGGDSNSQGAQQFDETATAVQNL